MSITKSLPEIAGKKITLSYSPATSSDEAVINSYLPKPHADGTPVQPYELPSSLPAYLINLKPELRIDGVVVATGGAIGMGQKENMTIDLTAPTTASNSINNSVIVGEFNAIALDLAKISSDQMIALQAKLGATKAKLQAQDFTGLTKDDILGDLLYTTVLSYFAELDTMDYVSAKTMGVLASRLPSAGRFFNALSIDYMWGTPVSASAGGLSMDIGLIRKLVKVPDGTKDKQIQFMLTSGLNSSVLEHYVPEMLLSTANNSVQGISAVKALQMANDQMIPIYTIDQSNIAAILPQLQINSEATTDIRNAVNAGKIVTASKNNITLNGWSGCGYLIIDPSTGAGAYMISGGLSGAQMLLDSFPELDTLLFLDSSVDAFIGIIEGYKLGLNPQLLSNAELQIARNFVASSDNCAHYDLMAIYDICMAAGSSTWANVARYGLRNDFLAKGYSAEWLSKDHAKWFTYAILIQAEYL